MIGPGSRLVGLQSVPSSTAQFGDLLCLSNVSGLFGDHGREGFLQCRVHRKLLLGDEKVIFLRS